MAIELYSFTDASDGISVDGGSNKRVMVYVGATNSGSDSISAVSWNSENFTKAGSIQSGTARYVSVWYLVPTGTGSHTFNVTGQGASSGLFVYLNAKNPKNFNSKNGSSGTSDGVSITANNGDWLVGGGISNVGNISVGASTTQRSANSSIIQVDSNGVASPTALNFTFSVGNYALAGIAIEPILSLTMAQGSFTYTGYSAILRRIYTLIASYGSYALSGFALLLSLTRKWVMPDQNTSSWSEQNQNTSTMNLQSKNSSSWTNQNQN